MIHAAKILNADGSYCDTKPGQVFKYLDEDITRVEENGHEIHASQWWSSRQLTRICDTTAIGTRIYEVRAQLPGGDLFNERHAVRLRGYELPPAVRRGGHFYYRLIWRPSEKAEQMAFEEA